MFSFSVVLLSLLFLIGNQYLAMGDTESAFMWLRHASDLGSPQASYNLGNARSLLRFLKLSHTHHQAPFCGLATRGLSRTCAVRWRILSELVRAVSLFRRNSWPLCVKQTLRSLQMTMSSLSITPRSVSWSLCLLWPRTSSGRGTNKHRILTSSISLLVALPFARDALSDISMFRCIDAESFLWEFLRKIKKSNTNECF
jgi:hypothetical protein